MSTSPLLVVICPMDLETRGHMLESVGARHRVWLFIDHEPTWELAHAAGYTVVDTLDADAMTEAARRIGADAIVCWDETRILAAASVARSLDLPGLSPAAVRACRDKHTTRQAFAEAGGPQPVSALVDTLPEAVAAARDIGYPVVIKPRALVGSTGTRLARDEHELTGIFPVTRGITMPEVRERFASAVLVEEYLDGPEISVDTLVWDGVATPLYVARKQLSPLPNFEEVGHSVERDDPLVRDPELRRVLGLVHAAVGITHGWTHSEWRLTTSGPRLVEVNARSGGDLISYLGRLVTGADAGLAAAELALGRRPVPGPAGPATSAAVRFLYPPEETVVGAVTIDEQALPAGIVLARALAGPGHLLELPPASHTGRYAVLVAAADSTAACERILDRAEQAVRLTPAERALAAPR
ncbi:ATP-grasp domain-containing protein [Krasilnikovia sp. MM14-A1259]|uniref:ATP-grasp domain-containing protein n=1 Tax=Krasilnikovia sp. MM14-A1259 TaxID=3373539 RepID=UPI00380D4CEA